MCFGKKTSASGAEDGGSPKSSGSVSFEWTRTVVRLSGSGFSSSLVSVLWSISCNLLRRVGQPLTLLFPPIARVLRRVLTFNRRSQSPTEKKLNSGHRHVLPDSDGEGDPP